MGRRSGGERSRRIFATFLTSFADMSLILGPHQPVKPDSSAVLIKEVRAFIFSDDDDEKQQGGGADCHKQAAGHWIVDSDIANPMSVYEQYRASRTSWGIDAMGSVIVEVELSNGMVGVGISIGGDAATSRAAFIALCGRTGSVQCGADLGSNVSCHS